MAQSPLKTKMAAKMKKGRAAETVRGTDQLPWIQKWNQLAKTRRREGMNQLKREPEKLELKVTVTSTQEYWPENVCFIHALVFFGERISTSLSFSSFGEQNKGYNFAELEECVFFGLHYCSVNFEIVSLSVRSCPTFLSGKCA